MKSGCLFRQPVIFFKNSGVTIIIKNHQLQTGHAPIFLEDFSFSIWILFPLAWQTGIGNL